MAATMPVPSVARARARTSRSTLVALVDKALAWDRRNRFDDARQMQGRGARGALPSPRARAADEAIAPQRDAAVALRTEGRARPPPPPRPPALRRSVPRPPSPPARAPAEPVAAENDPRVETAKELFHHVDRVFPNVRQFGWEHPATDRALRTAFEAFAEALAKQPRRRPRCPTLLPPGARARRLGAGRPLRRHPLQPLRLRRCAAFARARAHPRRAPRLSRAPPPRPRARSPPEDDLVSAFWERALEHVTCEVVDAFAEGDASEREVFYGQADEVEARRGRRRAQGERARSESDGGEHRPIASWRSAAGRAIARRWGSTTSSARCSRPSSRSRATGGASGTWTRSSRGTSTRRRIATRRWSSPRSGSPPPTSSSPGA